MSWAWSFYLREWSLLYKYKRIMSSHFCREWSFWSFLNRVSKMNIMLIMLTVITSDSSDQSNHFKTLITQWLFNHCCYIILCKRVLIQIFLKIVKVIERIKWTVSHLMKSILIVERSHTTALSIYCHSWQSRDMQLYLWR